MATCCTQLKAGSVCEEMGKRWGLLPGSFCLASQMCNGDFYTDLENAVRIVFDKYLHPVNCQPQPAGLFESELLRICHVHSVPQNHDDDDTKAEKRIGQEKRQTEAEEFHRFPKSMEGSDGTCTPGRVLS